MNKIKILGIIAVIISIVVIYGYISSNSSNTQTYMVSNSFFQVPEGWNSGWAVGGIPNPTTSFLYGNTNLMLFIEQYPDEEDFNCSRGKHRPNSTHKIDISGINVTYMQDSVSNLQENVSNYIISRYYFQKNGKYFLVQIGDSRKNKDYPDQKVINNTVKTVITTIN